MPTTSPRTIKVFIASTGDLAVERRAFKDTIDRWCVNPFSHQHPRESVPSSRPPFRPNRLFEPPGWEDALARQDWS